jgi:hypothetical protein
MELAVLGGIIVLLFNLAVGVFLLLLKLDNSASLALLVSLGVIFFGLRIIEIGFIYSRVKQGAAFTRGAIKAIVFFENTWLAAYFCLTGWAIALLSFDRAYFPITLLPLLLIPIAGRNIAKQKIFAGGLPPESIAAGETLFYQIRRPFFIASGVWLLMILGLGAAMIGLESAESPSLAIWSGTGIAGISIIFSIYLYVMVMRARGKMLQRIPMGADESIQLPDIRE